MLGAVMIVQEKGAAGPESIERTVAALRSECETVLVFGGSEQSDNPRPLPRHASELTAVTFALREANDDHVAIAAADLAHPSAELLRYMSHIRGSFDAVVPEFHDGALQPLFALYHGSLRRRAEGLLTAGERDLQPLLDAGTVRRVTVEEVAKFGDPDRLLERAGSAPL